MLKGSIAEANHTHDTLKSKLEALLNATDDKSKRTLDRYQRGVGQKFE